MHKCPVAVRQPAEWTPLITVASDHISGGAPAAETVLAIATAADQLDNERLEVVRYASLAEMMRGTANLLEQPAFHDQIVGTAADLLAHSLAKPTMRSQSAFACPTAVPNGPLKLADLRGTPMAPAFRPTIEAGRSALPLAEQITIDVITALSQSRQRALRRSDEPWPDIPQQLAYGKRASVITSAAANNIQDNILGGAVMALKASYRTAHGIPMNEDPIINTSELAALDVSTVVKQLSWIHFDTLVSHVSSSSGRNSVIQNAAGNLRVDPAVMTLPPPISIDQQGEFSPIHLERIGCPARKVPGLIQLVTAMVPEIAVATNEVLKNPASR